MKRLFLNLITLCLTACSTSGETHMQQSELLELLQSEQRPVIIDVRSRMEYNAGHIPHAYHIPFWKSFTNSNLDAAPRQQAIVLYCEHGPRAGIAKLAYTLAGFENIRYLDGHMTAWRAAQLPMEK